MRFDAAGGALDPEGGVVTPGEGGTIHGPVAASDGTHFRLLWGEEDGDALVLRTQRFAADGSPVEVAPVTIASIGVSDPFDPAATPDATLAAWLSASTTQPGEPCLHVMPISQ